MYRYELRLDQGGSQPQGGANILPVCDAIRIIGTSILAFDALKIRIQQWASPVVPFGDKRQVKIEVGLAKQDEPISWRQTDHLHCRTVIDQGILGTPNLVESLSQVNCLSERGSIPQNRTPFKVPSPQFY